MAVTEQFVVTSAWQQVAISDCTMQSITGNTIYDVFVGELAPVDDIALKLPLLEPTTFAYKTPVWIRLNAKGPSNMERRINIIK